MLNADDKNVSEYFLDYIVKTRYLEYFGLNFDCDWSYETGTLKP